MRRVIGEVRSLQRWTHKGGGSDAKTDHDLRAGAIHDRVRDV